MRLFTWLSGDSMTILEIQTYIFSYEWMEQIYKKIVVTNGTAFLLSFAQYLHFLHPKGVSVSNPKLAV